MRSTIKSGLFLLPYHILSRLFSANLKKIFSFSLNNFFLQSFDLNNRLLLWLTGWIQLLTSHLTCFCSYLPYFLLHIFLLFILKVYHQHYHLYHIHHHHYSPSSLFTIIIAFILIIIFFFSSSYYPRPSRFIILKISFLSTTSFPFYFKGK